jgi:hypothetical protein
MIRLLVLSPTHSPFSIRHGRLLPGGESPPALGEAATALANCFAALSGDSQRTTVDPARLASYF